MKLTLKLTHNSYDILIEAGCIHDVSRYIDPMRNIFIVSDSGVPKEYIESVRHQFKKSDLFILKAGEASKNIQNYQAILSLLIEKHYTRKDLIIALGGGVVGDLAGFVAATYLRGIDYINIPTTALSQIDSSIGGKVGINFGQVKNMVGAFYHPKMVFIDPNVLKSLTQRQLNNGLVEAIKAGLIYDASLFECFELEAWEDQLIDIIHKALLVKKAVVEQDETEQNLRKILNFGHTLGHAIESLTGFERLYHGECVALGILPMIENDELKARVLSVFKKLDLATSISLNKDELYQRILNDKKVNSDAIDLVFVRNCGQAEIEKKSFADIHRYIDRL